MTDRFHHLSTSTSGLHYVRERNGGVLRALTESELADFNDPPPCVDCGEQFGCGHRNIAGEPLMAEADADAIVPERWRWFAREHGLSRADVDRLSSLELVNETFRAAPGADVRTLELVVLLNEER